MDIVEKLKSIFRQKGVEEQNDEAKMEAVSNAIKTFLDEEGYHYALVITGPGLESPIIGGVHGHGHNILSMAHDVYSEVPEELKQVFIDHVTNEK